MGDVETEDLQPKNYELAFHLTPDLGEEEVRKETGEIENIVKKIGGSVVFLKEPSRTHLSYPIKHKGYAYFGFVDFSTLPDSIEKLHAEMKVHTPVLRYLLIQKNPERKKFSATPRVTTHVPPKTQEESSAKPEEIEKELEEVLEKI